MLGRICLVAADSRGASVGRIDLILQFHVPEYIPKLVLSPPWAKCVSHMLNRGSATTSERNSDDIKTKLVSRVAVPIHPTLSHLRDLALLRPGDSLQRATKDRAGARFYLYERHNRTVTDDQVDLTAAYPETVGQNPITHRFQEPLRYQLTGQPPPVAGILPCRWI